MSPHGPRQGWPRPSVAALVAAAAKTLIREVSDLLAFPYLDIQVARARQWELQQLKPTRRLGRRCSRRQEHSQLARRWKLFNHQHPECEVMLCLRYSYSTMLLTCTLTFKTVWHTRGCLDIVNFVPFFFLSKHLVYKGLACHLISLTSNYVNDNQQVNVTTIQNCTAAAEEGLKDKWNSFFFPVPSHSAVVRGVSLADFWASVELEIAKDVFQW